MNTDDDCGQITNLLIGWGNGDQGAFDRLIPLVYRELRAIAQRHMNRQSPGHTLQTTALVHEAYFRLVGESQPHFANRSHFYAVAARAMRQILVDYARANGALKRGGASPKLVFDEAYMLTESRMQEVVALDDALTELDRLSPRQCQVVEMRFFGGLSVEESAKVLNVSPETVMRDWRVAKAWLYKELDRSGPDAPPQT